MPLNSQGIYEYDGTEQLLPYFTTFENSVTDVVAAIRSQIAGLATPTDSGWVPITTFGAGVASTGTAYTPRVRRVGNRVDLLGAVTLSAGFNRVNILTIPAGYRPAPTYISNFIGAFVSSGGGYAEWFITTADNLLQYAPNGTYVGGPTIAAGQVLPLHGSWFIS